MKQLCFVLKSFSLYPTGGAKMIFEYANRLSDIGHKVQILYLNDEALLKYRLPEKVRENVVSTINLVSPTWFKLNKDIECLSLYDGALDKKVEKTDVFIATSITTVEPMLTRFQNKNFLYFIQGFENWSVPDEYCYKTYNMGMTNIVVSNWLKKIVDKHSSQESYLIKNPIDTSHYRQIISISERDKHTIGLLYHEMPHKGLKYSLKVINEIKKMYPDLEVFMFGVPKRPRIFPKWIHYTRKATQQETVSIYNKVQVFLCSTIEEGFGLTGLEAMACGTPLVSTDYEGVKEYAVNEVNALLSPVKDIDAMIKNVIRIFENTELREKISKNGISTAKSFDWNNAVREFNMLIER